MLWIIAATALAQSPSVERDVVYTRAGGEETRMDIFRPAARERPTPAVVVIHGGAWIAGRRQDMDSLAQAFAERGVLAASISYRLAPKHRWPAMIDDAQTAVRYLRFRAGDLNIDPNRIGAAGGSAGGHLALLLGSIETRDEKPAEYPDYSSRVRAVFNIFGPVDLNQPFPFNVDPIIFMVMGKRREEAAEQIAQASPINHLSSRSAPTFTLHGDQDRTVSVDQARILDAALKKHGVRHETVIVEGMGHSIEMTKPEVRAAVERGIQWTIEQLRR
ncbi:MAG: alpha/beta hydrolase [Fimbriimonadaceae bacterium]